MWTDVTFEDGRTTECEDRARILEAEFAIKVTFPSELSAAGAKRGVRRVPVPKYTRPDDPF